MPATFIPVAIIRPTSKLQLKTL